MTPRRDIAFKDITDRLSRWRFPERLDGVVGIGRGGAVPAALTAQFLGLELKIIGIRLRDDANVEIFDQPRLEGVVPDLGEWKRILLVDDVYVSGRSWNAARSYFSSEIEMLPFVFKGKAEFALIQDVEGCVNWPWSVVAA